MGPLAKPSYVEADREKKEQKTSSIKAKLEVQSLAYYKPICGCPSAYLLECQDP